MPIRKPISRVLNPRELRFRIINRKKRRSKPAPGNIFFELSEAIHLAAGLSPEGDSLSRRDAMNVSERMAAGKLADKKTALLRALDAHADVYRDRWVGPLVVGTMGGIIGASAIGMGRKVFDSEATVLSGVLVGGAAGALITAAPERIKTSLQLRSLTRQIGKALQHMLKTLTAQYSAHAWAQRLDAIGEHPNAALPRMRKSGGKPIQSGAVGPKRHAVIRGLRPFLKKYRYIIVGNDKRLYGTNTPRLLPWMKMRLSTKKILTGKY